MSKFATRIPVDTDAVTNALPTGAFIHSVLLGEDRKSIIIVWDCDDWKTPYTVPVDISPAMLFGKEKLPDLVKRAVVYKKVQNEEVAPNGQKGVKKKP